MYQFHLERKSIPRLYSVFIYTSYTTIDFIKIFKLRVISFKNT